MAVQNFASACVEQARGNIRKWEWTAFKFRTSDLLCRNLNLGDQTILYKAQDDGGDVLQLPTLFETSWPINQ